MLGSPAGYHRSADSTESQHSNLELSHVSCDGNVATHRFLVLIELRAASESACHDQQSSKTVTDSRLAALILRNGHV